MDPFFGSFPLSLSEKALQYRYPVNRIASSFTPLELDFKDDFITLITREIKENSLPTSPLQAKSIIDSLFDSDSELSEIDDREFKKPVEDKKKKSLPINPFKVSIDQVESDWKLIKQFLPVKSHQKTRKNILQESKRSLRNNSLNQDSDDNCTVCLGKGKVICCDSCPRVFHINCLDEVLDDGPLPEIWECKACRFKKVPEKSSLRIEKDDCGLGYLFGELLEDLQCMNPRIFHLTSYITNSFENILAHPITGDFINDSEVEIIKFNNTNQLKEANPTIKRNQITDSENLLNGYCYKCSRSNLKLLQTNLLSSSSVKQTQGLNLQRCNSELIKCDFCPLYWHLDCLDPPLANVPPELRENEIEIVNLKSINSIKAKLWGEDSVQSSDGTLSSSILDGLYSIRKKWMCPCHSQNLGHLKSSGWKWCTVYEDTENDSASDPDDVFLFSSSSKNNGQIEIINEKNTNDLFREMEYTKSKRRVGPIDSFAINGIRYRVPEKRVKLDFLSKSNQKQSLARKEKYRVLSNGELEFDQNALDSMFPGLDTKFHLVTPDDSLDLLLEAAHKAEKIPALPLEEAQEIQQSMSIRYITVKNSNMILYNLFEMFLQTNQHPAGCRLFLRWRLNAVTTSIEKLKMIARLSFLMTLLLAASVQSGAIPVHLNKRATTTNNSCKPVGAQPAGVPFGEYLPVAAKQAVDCKANS